MIQPSNNGINFYFTLEPDYRLREYAIRCGDSDEFPDFIQRNIDAYYSGGLLPDYWMFQYEIADEVLMRMREKEKMIGPDFFRNSLPILSEYGVAPQRIVRLRDAAFCSRYNIPYLTPQAAPEKLRSQEDYELTMQCFGDHPKLREKYPLFDTLTAVETHQGLLLFTHTSLGGACYEKLWDYYLLHYFHPQLQDTQLQVYQIPKLDNTWQEYADRFRLERDRDDKTRYAFDEIPPEIFAPKTLCAYGIQTHTFDLLPTVHDYEKLLNSVPHSSHYKDYSCDIASLQIIRENGLSWGTQHGILYDLFPSAKEFISLVHEYETTRYSPSAGQQVEQKSRKMAAEILKREYPKWRSLERQNKQVETTTELFVPSIPPNGSRGIKR